MMKGLVARDISAGYDKKPVLENVSFSAEKGSVTAILGPNGSGKSTLLKVISKIITPYKGEIVLDGEDLFSLSRVENAKKVAYLPQSRNTSDIKVSSLVLHGRFPYKGYPRRYTKEDYKKVDEALEKMGLQDKKDTVVSSLSGGERQKVYIAMCLVQETDVILFDEPTTFLDISRQFKVLSEAKELAREGKCVIVVLHDIIQALETADKIVVMKDGRTVAEDTPDAVYSSGILDSVFDIKIRKDSDYYHYLINQ
ncbi:MAG: ABC transporter ATP-binding protein [Candidatus Ornithospirochaeta sp.]